MKVVWMRRLAGMAAAAAAVTVAASPQVGISQWGPNDEIGRLNMMSPANQALVLARIDARRVYDLGTEYFIGMPSWQAAGDPHYQMWMTHTPHGTEIDDPIGVGKEQNRHVSYTGSAVSMYTHMGTHIDALNHFGLNGKIWNGFDAREHLGDRGWRKAGVEKLPPIIARGVLIDVAAAKGLEALAPGYRVVKQDLVDALRRQQLTLERGDVVLIRTGRMKAFGKAADYMDNPPGLGIEGARYLMEAGVMSVGADNLSLEAFPSEVAGDYVPVHTYLLAQQGATIIELAQLEELSRDRVYEFAFISASLKFRGADASPIRPLAIPLRKQ
jgi:kynurenine formamidase